MAEKCDGETQYRFVTPTSNAECQADDRQTPVVDERSSQTDVAVVQRSNVAAQTDLLSLDVRPLMSIAESQTSAVVCVDSVTQCVNVNKYFC